MELSNNAESQQKKVIHFTSGETLEEDEVEEDLDDEAPKQSFSKASMTNMNWRQHSWCWARQAVLKSFQTCDFLGGKLAGLLGLSLAKYQYAIDEYDRNHKIKMEKDQTLLTDAGGTGYGATSSQTSPEKQQTAGFQNHNYMHDE
ncbi:protein FAM177A1 [Brachyhypopomus gauderio]|uniref:protein FAM177A1 n=1 Tax=Brachyhypopomus gauderio TaxID=698409 RepID=UPI0040426B48